MNFDERNSEYSTLSTFNLICRVEGCARARARARARVAWCGVMIVHTIEKGRGVIHTHDLQSLFIYYFVFNPSIFFNISVT